MQGGREARASFDAIRAASLVLSVVILFAIVVFNYCEEPMDCIIFIYI